MIRFRLSPARRFGEIGLVVVERVESRAERRRAVVAASGSLEPVVVVLRDAAGVRAVSVEGAGRPLQELLAEEPDLSPLLQQAEALLAV